MNNFITNPLPYMGAKPYNRQKLQKLVDRDDPSLIFEYKYDGVYMSVLLGERIRAWLRSGREVPLECLGEVGQHRLHLDILGKCNIVQVIPGLFDSIFG